MLRDFQTWWIRRLGLVLFTSGIVITSVLANPISVDASQKPSIHRVIIFVWDGLRPDLISVADTPNLARLRDAGVNFKNHHSTYPTLTMINAASFATGAYPATHGFYGNVVWAPQANGHDAANNPVDFSAPVFTEDYAILQAIDRAENGKLLAVPTLFEIAHQQGLVTAIVGKGGPTFLQSRGVADFFMDDKTVMPLSAAAALSTATYPLPAQWAKAYQFSEVPNYRVVGNLSVSNIVPVMVDGITADPSNKDAVINVAANSYQANVFINYVLPTIKPQLSMLWLKNPDSTEHAFGPGSYATRNVLRANDAVLGDLLNKLGDLGWKDQTDIIVVSDHGHSHISGDFQHFPLRTIVAGDVGEISADGYSVSGEVRSADLLRRAGLLAFDGSGPQCNPVMSGIRADRTSVYTHRSVSLFDLCKQADVTGDFRIPDAEYLKKPYAVIAIDGGSEYYYVPSHDLDFVKALVKFFQSHSQYGAVFIDEKRYGELPGTLPLSSVRLLDSKGNNPDLIVSFAFDADARVSDIPGIEYCGGAASNRGMHGSFSPRDVHNVLIASGADFKTEYADEVPTGNIDVAPTVAHLLGLELQHADGRVLYESLNKSGNVRVSVRQESVVPRKPVKGLHVVAPTDPDGKEIDPLVSSYTIDLQTTVVKQRVEGRTREYRYFDSANAIRK
jgi:arylsulfatase A-like enzyme